MSHKLVDQTVKHIVWVGIWWVTTMFFISVTIYSIIWLLSF